MKLNELITSETQPSEPTYSGDIGFDVMSAVEEEKKASKEAEKKNLADYLKKRSDFRLALRTGKQTMGDKETDKKTVNTSSLADMFTDVMVGMGKDPKYMQDTYGSSQGNIDLINKMKAIQGGKFSGDIQNYIDGRSDDLTGLVNNMFPDYVAKKTGVATQTPKQVATQTSKLPEKDSNVLQGDTRSGWDKMAEKVTQFKWSDIGLESEKQPIRGIANILGGFIDTTQKIIPGTMDIFYELTTTSPEKFNKALDEGYYIQSGVKKNAKEAYDRAVKYQGYKGNYNQWVEDSKKSYADLYNQSTSGTKSIDESRGDYWFNTMDEESLEFRGGQLGSEVIQQVVLDKWFTNALNKGAGLYKGLKGTKDVSKGTELATKGTELAIKGEEALSSPKTLQESKDIANRIVDWYNKGGGTQDLVKAGAEGGKAGLEYQLIGDVQEGKLSDAQAYGLSAGFGSLLGTIFNSLSKGAEFISEPKKQLQTSLSRIGGKDTTQILDWAEAGAKDGTLPSALQRTTDMAVKEAKENTKRALDKAGEDLGNFRKALGQSDLTVSDLNNTINKGLTEKGVGAKIVEKDGKYTIEGYPGQYGDVLNKIVDRMNSAIENVKNKYEMYKAGEEADFWTNTRVVEDLISDLKSFSMREPNAEVRQKFIEIENSLMDDLKGGMGESQRTKYKGYLDDYSKLKNKYNKVEELEGKMNNKSVIDQPKLEDGQYLSDFLNELTADGTISNNAADRRIAAIFADAFYGGPVKDTDKLIYPSVPGIMEGFMKLAVQTLRNPRSKMTGGWGKYATDYKPSTLRKAVQKGAEQAKTTTIGKVAEQPREE